MSDSDETIPSSRLTSIVVETSSVKHKSFRQESQDESYSEQHQRLSKAPAVPPVAEELKNIEEAALLDDDERKDIKTVKSDKLKHRDTASHSKPRGQSPEKMLNSLDSTKHVQIPNPNSPTIHLPLVQPIPAVDESKTAPVPDQGKKSDDLDSSSTYSVLHVEPKEKASVTATDAAGTQGVWSDDDEAGGLPRDAQGSRMARAFRRLLCLGSDDSDDFDTKPKHENDLSPRTEDSGI